MRNLTCEIRCFFLRFVHLILLCSFAQLLPDSQLIKILCQSVTSRNSCLFPLVRIGSFNFDFSSLYNLSDSPVRSHKQNLRPRLSDQDHQHQPSSFPRRSRTPSSLNLTLTPVSLPTSLETISAARTDLSQVLDKRAVLAVEGKGSFAFSIRNSQDERFFGGD